MTQNARRSEPKSPWGRKLLSAIAPSGRGVTYQQAIDLIGNPTGSLTAATQMKGLAQNGWLRYEHNGIRRVYYVGERVKRGDGPLTANTTPFAAWERTKASPKPVTSIFEYRP